jgi:hypothetical protein
MPNIVKLYDLAVIIIDITQKNWYLQQIQLIFNQIYFVLKRNFDWEH